MHDDLLFEADSNQVQVAGESRRLHALPVPHHHPHGMFDLFVAPPVQHHAHVRIDDIFIPTCSVISFAGIQEYYNISMFTPTTKKYIYNRITWLYFIVRNVIAYGKICLCD